MIGDRGEDIHACLVLDMDYWYSMLCDMNMLCDVKSSSQLIYKIIKRE